MTDKKEEYLTEVISFRGSEEDLRNIDLITEFNNKAREKNPTIPGTTNSNIARECFRIGMKKILSNIKSRGG